MPCWLRWRTGLIAAEPRLLGKIAHNANVTPEHNAKYHEILRRRKIEEGQSKKCVDAPQSRIGWKR